MPQQKPRRYETRKPTINQSNFLLFSMHGLQGINHYLKNFPKDKTAVSATLLYSGAAGYNVPVQTFEAETRYTGFVIDPKKIDMPQADKIAYKSQGYVAKEFKKNNTSINGEKYTSKYPNKAGYLRPMGYATNLARHERRQQGESTYHDVGSAKTFGGNIWHKFFKWTAPSHQHQPPDKNNAMRLNEALVFQKGDVNPITGLFLTKTPDRAMANGLKEILHDNPTLKLYLYDIDAKENIVRWLDNGEAQKYLGQRNLDFNQAFTNATPFGGENNYKYYATKQEASRKHLFEAEMPDQSLRRRYSNFKGDFLKTRILNKLQEEINEISTPEELAQYRQALNDRPEFKVLATGQGLTTRLFRLKTSSVDALEEMLNKKEQALGQPQTVKKSP